MVQPKAVCWPDRLQELLLRATILDGDAATAAWEKWSAKAEFPNLDEGSTRLLPETYTNLVRNGVDHEWFGRMRGYKRRAWLKNQLLFHQGAEVIRILHAGGIQTMVTKGPALVLCHYLDYGRRPMADFDIAVRKSTAEKAIETLLENGFRLEKPIWEAGDLDLRHALTYINSRGRQFDLHWQVIGGCADDHRFWEDAGPVSFHESSTLAPCPTDLLLHVCVHGLRLNVVPPLRWVVDATIILKNSEVDWDRLAEISKRFGLQYRLRKALRYLARFDVDVPKEVLSLLSGGDPFGLQKLEFESTTGLRGRSSGSQFAMVSLGFRRYAGQETGLRRIAKLGRYSKLTVKKALRSLRLRLKANVARATQAAQTFVVI